MEVLVPRLPLPQGRGRKMCPPLGHARQKVERGDDAGLPLVTAVADRTAQRLGLQEHPHAGEVGQLVDRYRRHPEAAVVRGIDQLLGAQPDQGLAQGRHADVVALLEFVHAELGVGGECPGQDVVAELAIGDGGEGHATVVAVDDLRRERAVGLVQVAAVAARCDFHLVVELVASIRPISPSPR